MANNQYIVATRDGKGCVFHIEITESGNPCVVDVAVCQEMLRQKTEQHGFGNVLLLKLIPFASSANIVIKEDL